MREESGVVMVLMRIMGISALNSVGCIESNWLVGVPEVGFTDGGDKSVICPCMLVLRNQYAGTRTILGSTLFFE